MPNQLGDFVTPYPLEASSAHIEVTLRLKDTSTSALLPLQILSKTTLCPKDASSQRALPLGRPRAPSILKTLIPVKTTMATDHP